MNESSVPKDPSDSESVSEIATLLEATFYSEVSYYAHNFVILEELVDGSVQYKPVENHLVLNAIFAGDQFSNSDFKPIRSNFPIKYLFDLEKLVDEDNDQSKKRVLEFYDFDFSRHFSLGNDFGANGLNLVPNVESSIIVKRPQSAFLIFCNEQIGMLKDEEKINSSERAKGYGARWRAMTDLEKKPYNDEQRRRFMEHQKKYPGHKFTRRFGRSYEIDGRKVARKTFNKWMEKAQGPSD